jgi:hypothetical protein
MPSAAAVVDLQDFRRRREARQAKRAPAPSQVRTAVGLPCAPVVPVPVWLVWMPVWTVA